jgi:hypothetical protein
MAINNEAQKRGVSELNDTLTAHRQATSQRPRGLPAPATAPATPHLEILLTCTYCLRRRPCSRESRFARGVFSDFPANFYDPELNKIPGARAVPALSRGRL